MADHNTRAYTLKELADFIGASLEGDPACVIHDLATIQRAGPGCLSFLANPVYRKYLATTQADAVIIQPEDAALFAGNKLISDSPYLAFARLSRLFDTYCAKSPGVHASAVIDKSAKISKSASIGPGVVIEAGVQVGEHTEIGAHCFIGQDSMIGDHCRLSPNISIYHGVAIGNECLLHSGVIIGSDGFGFARDASGWVKVYQLGGVEIGNRVEIGAGTTIDRGAMENTVIADGVIIDNQVQIAHNVRIGRNTAIAGCAAVAGSTVIGENCTIAGAAGIVGHLTITDNVHITAMTLVTKSINEPGSYSSGTPLSPSREWRKNAVRFNQLNQLIPKLKKLEKEQQNNS